MIPRDVQALLDDPREAEFRRLYDPIRPLIEHICRVCKETALFPEGSGPTHFHGRNVPMRAIGGVKIGTVERILRGEP